jgi:ABC-type polysaccharide/polyol phosphate export permease
LIIAISSVVSSFWSNAAAATATSYGILLTLFAGTLLIWLSKGKPFGESFVEKALVLNPTAAALAEIRTPGFENYQLTPLSWWIAGTVSGLCLILLAARVWQLTKPE